MENNLDISIRKNNLVSGHVLPHFNGVKYLIAQYLDKAIDMGDAQLGGGLTILVRDKDEFKVMCEDAIEYYEDKYVDMKNNLLGELMYSEFVNAREEILDIYERQFNKFLNILEGVVNVSEFKTNVTSNGIRQFKIV